MDGIYYGQWPTVQRSLEQEDARRAHISLTEQWDGGYQILGMSQIKAKKIIWKKDFVLYSVSNWCYLVR